MSKNYDISLYNHEVNVAIESEEMKKIEQVLGPELEYAREIAKRIFGDEKMSNLTLTYHGTVYSKKNSKRIIYNPRTKRPMLISSKQAETQEDEMKLAFMRQANAHGWNLEIAPAKHKIYEVTMGIWQPDHRRRDLDNQATAILDALVKAEVLPDDDAEHVQDLHVVAMGVDKSDPRVFIEIIATDKED